MALTFTDLASFQLALMGIMVSVLTLVFAIVVGKRDELRTLKPLNDTVAKNRKVALDNSLITLKSFCRHIILIIMVLLLLYIGTMVLDRVLCEESKCLISFFDVVVTVGVLIWVVTISIVIWNKINKD